MTIKTLLVAAELRMYRIS